MRRIFLHCLMLLLLIHIVAGCDKDELDIQQLRGKSLGIPVGLTTDEQVLSKIPEASVRYYDNLGQAVEALQDEKVNAVVYDQVILKRIAANVRGLSVMDALITEDKYALAFRKEDEALKRQFDQAIRDLESRGVLADMEKRWMPEQGQIGLMPDIPLMGQGRVLKIGTCGDAKPFAFFNGHQIEGYDIELVTRIAEKLGMRVEIQSMEFSSLIPALQDGRIDVIASGLTVTRQRAESVLFSEPYLHTGLGIMVRK